MATSMPVFPWTRCAPASIASPSPSVAAATQPGSSSRPSPATSSCDGPARWISSRGSTRTRGTAITTATMTTSSTTEQRSGGSMRSLMITILLGTAVAASASAQDFNWHGRIARGKRLEVKGVNGDVRAGAATRGEAGGDAEKTAPRSHPDDVEVEGVQGFHGGTIFAGYPKP